MPFQSKHDRNRQMKQILYCPQKLLKKCQREAKGDVIGYFISFTIG